jgi:hypothetical protein
MVGDARRKDALMLEVKKDRAAAAPRDPTTAQYVDRMARESRPITLRIDERPPLAIKDERAYQLLWELVDRLETIEAVREGLKQMENGEGRPAEEFFQEMRQKLGNPPEE